MIIELIDEAVRNGARRDKATALLGLSARAVARWRRDVDADDRRRGPSTAASHALTQSERELILATANRAEYRNLSPRQIVPLLADRGEYIASESSFYRVLREAGQLAHRQHARPVRRHRPKEHVARGPNEVWSWDITYLRGPVRGTFFYLYLIVDVWSRKIVGRNLLYEESAEHARDLVEQAVADEDVDSGKLVLHADNGGPMKGSTLLATLQRLGVVPSFSRPSVSDDNPFSEALFRTMKYRPDYPRKPFASFAEALQWVESFVSWYNNEHLHSGIRYVTPADRHSRKERPILSKRHAVYTAAQRRTPRRWTGSTRNWSPVGAVYLNPIKQEVRVSPIASPMR
jgi:transposase InsO family protein